MSVNDAFPNCIIEIKKKRETINVSTIAVIHYFFNGHLSEASVIDFKYIKMKGMQDF